MRFAQMTFRKAFAPVPLQAEACGVADHRTVGRPGKRVIEIPDRRRDDNLFGREAEAEHHGGKDQHAVGDHVHFFYRRVAFFFHGEQHSLATATIGQRHLGQFRLGLVNFKRVNDAWKPSPKSLRELDDPELDQAFEDMMRVVYEKTGVDPATLRKEIADVGREQRETPPVPKPAGAGSDGHPSPNPQPVAAEPSEAPACRSPGAPESGAGQAPVPQTNPALLQECLDKLLALATDPYGEGDGNGIEPCEVLARSTMNSYGLYFPTASTMITTRNARAQEPRGRSVDRRRF